MKKAIKEKLTKFRPGVVIASVGSFVVVAAILISYLIRGYRPDFSNGTLFPTGILAATSVPKGALVYIDDKLVTATDDTTNLPPGEYQIKLVKDGYFPWEKQVTLKKEVVYQTGAYLFRTNPDLKPLTATGAINPSLSPDKSKIVYSVASASASLKNGIWLSETGSGGLNPIKNTTRQLAQPMASVDWTKAHLVWNPESAQVLAVFGSLADPVSAYLLEADRFNPPDQMRNIVLQLPLILSRWQESKKAALTQELARLPKEMEAVASRSAELINFSPDGKKFFYLASREETIPDNLIPHPPARSDQPEQREIKPGNIYVYNKEEDTNFFFIEGEKIGIGPETAAEKEGTVNLEQYQRENTVPIHWLATDNHLVLVEEGQVKVMEIDTTNKHTIFSGSLINGYAFPAPDGNRLIILTSMHPSLPANLYAVTIR